MRAELARPHPWFMHHAPVGQRVAWTWRADAVAPTPSLSGGADGVRASGLHHTVERVDGDVPLGRPMVVRARAQPVEAGGAARTARCLPVRRAGAVGPAAWARSRQSRPARRPPRGSTSVPFGCLDTSRRRCPMRACASNHSASGFALSKSCGGLPITPVSPVAARTCASAPRCLRRSRG